MMLLLGEVEAGKYKKTVIPEHWIDCHEKLADEYPITQE